ncbi:MAG: hypothetical protein KAJ19_13265 [Gammaproteobacteria bacterium]|nr:hypothetical protein [Gammaproteobacteria bacterium]
MKKLIEKIKDRIEFLWTPDRDPAQTWIDRTVVILAFMGLPLALFVLSALIYWIVF